MTSKFNPGLFTILGFKGTAPDSEFRSLVEKYPPAGFLLLGENYESPGQLASLTSRLREMAGDRVLIAVDQEPGRVSRFQSGFPISRKPSYYVENGLESEFRRWCAETASLLAETGVNLNLAPVLDLADFSNPNPVLRDRVFGDDPDTVSAYGGILIEEHKKRGILTCGKHFPGLGSTVSDPHLKLSISNISLEEYENQHWKPFKSALSLNVDLIMTTHLLAASVDPDKAATYSSSTIELLRKNIGYQEPVISDDLAMGGAGERQGIVETATNSIRAGHNLVIISRDTAFQACVLDSLKNRYAQDALFGKIANQNEKIIRKLQDKIVL